MAESTIRLRQIREPEVSGFITEIILQYLNNSGVSIASTGSLTGQFYPLNSNPHQYQTTGSFATITDIENALIQQSISINQTYYPRTNPSGFVVTGDKAYLPAYSHYTYGYVVPHDTYFSGVLSVGGLLSTQYLHLRDAAGENSVLWGIRQLRDEDNGLSLNWAGRILSGNWKAQSMTISGSRPVLASETGNFGGATNTGQLTGAFYPRHSNPSGYITSGQTIDFVTTGQTGNFGGNTGSLTGAFYPRTGNPSGYLLSSQTGNFLVKGVSSDNGSLVLSHKDTASYPFFYDGDADGRYDLQAGDSTNGFSLVDFHGRSPSNIWGVPLLSGFRIYGTDILSNGFQVITTNDTGNFVSETYNDTDVVKTTGDQTIGGNKTFDGTTTFGYQELGIDADGILSNVTVRDANFYDTAQEQTVLFFMPGSRFSLNDGSGQAHVSFFDTNPAKDHRISGFDINAKSLTINSRPTVSGVGVLLIGEAGTGFVPYAGATQDINLNNRAITNVSSVAATYFGTSDGSVISEGKLYDAGPNVTLDWAGRILSGNWKAQSMTISGSNVIIASQTGAFITTGQTGNFGGNTGSLTGAFYPRTGNPSGYLLSSQTGNFLVKGVSSNNRSLVLFHNDTTSYPFFYDGDADGRYDLQAGDLTNGFSLVDFHGRSPSNIWGVPLLSGFRIYGTDILSNGFQVITTNDTGSFGGSGGPSNTGELTGIFYPRTGNPSGFVTTGQTGNFASAANLATTGSVISQWTGISTGLYYPRTGNISGFVTTGQTGNFASASNLITTGNLLSQWTGSSTGLYYPRTGNISGFVTTGQTGNFASASNLITTGNLLSQWTGSSTGLYYPRTGNISSFITGNQTGQFYPRTNISGYLTGVIAGTGMTVVNNNNGSFTIHTTGIQGIQGPPGNGSSSWNIDTTFTYGTTGWADPEVQDFHTGYSYTMTDNQMIYVDLKVFWGHWGGQGGAYCDFERHETVYFCKSGIAAGNVAEYVGTISLATTGDNVMRVVLKPQDRPLNFKGHIKISSHTMNTTP